MSYFDATNPDFTGKAVGLRISNQTGNRDSTTKAANPKYAGVNFDGSKSMGDAWGRIASQAYGGGKKLSMNDIAHIQDEVGGVGMYKSNGDDSYSLDDRYHGVDGSLFSEKPKPDSPTNSATPDNVINNKLPTLANRSPSGGGAAGGGAGAGGGGNGNTGGGGNGGGNGGGGWSANGAPQTGFNLQNIQGPTSWGVDPRTQTVSGQLEGILAKGSPLMQQATTRALQQQNASGRLNSTMAASAGDAAMYDAALQIATPDAATYGRAAQFNAEAGNQFAADANQFTRQGYMADFNLQANEWAAGRDQGRQLERDAKQNEFTSQRDGKQNDFTLGRDTQQNQFATERDRVQNAANVERDRVQNTNNNDQQVRENTRTDNNAAEGRLYGARADFTTALDRIMGNTTMGAEARRDAIRSLKTNYNAIISMAAKDLGWDDSSWVIEGDFGDDKPEPVVPEIPTAPPAPPVQQGNGI